MVEPNRRRMATFRVLSFACGGVDAIDLEEYDEREPSDYPTAVPRPGTPPDARASGTMDAAARASGTPPDAAARAPGTPDAAARTSGTPIDAARTSGTPLDAAAAVPAPASAAPAKTYDSAVAPGSVLARSVEGDDASLVVWLRARDLSHLIEPLLGVGARTIGDLAHLTPSDLATVGVEQRDIPSLTVRVVR